MDDNEERDTPSTTAETIVPIDNAALKEMAARQGFDLTPRGQQRTSSWSLLGEAHSPDAAERQERRRLHYAAIGAVTVIITILGSVLIMADTFGDIFEASLQIADRAMSVIEHQADVAAATARHQATLSAPAPESEPLSDRAYFMAAFVGLAVVFVVIGILRMLR